MICIYIYMGHDIYTFFGNYKPTYNLGAPSSSSPKIERTVGNRRTFFRKKYHLIHLIYISKSNHIFSEKLLALIWGPIFLSLAVFLSLTEIWCLTTPAVDHFPHFSIAITWATPHVKNHQYTLLDLPQQAVSQQATCLQVEIDLFCFVTLW